MARFALKSLEPLSNAAAAKIDKAAAVDDITARTDSLLTAREENSASFGKAARGEIFKMAGSALLALVGAGAAFSGWAAATSVFALIAGSTGVAVPLAVAGLVAFGAGAALTVISAQNYGRVKEAWHKLTDKADNAVKSLVKAYPQETAKASKLAAFLKSTFNPAASAQQPKAGPAPAVPPPQPAGPAA